MVKRVLIVEDDPEVLAVERMLLEDELSLAVDEATTVRDALRLARLNSPDLVILDLLLPDGDGVEVLMALREDRRLEAVPVMVVTAMYGSTHRNRVRAAGATDIMYKPFDAGAFVAHAASLLSRSTGPGYAAPAP